MLIDLHGYKVTVTVGNRVMGFVARIGGETIEGSIKWDGSSDCNLHTSNGMIHFSTRQELEAFNDLLVSLYDLAADQILMWDNQSTSLIA